MKWSLGQVWLLAAFGAKLCAFAAVVVWLGTKAISQTIYKRLTR